jgi:hypothetical protein
MLKGRVAGRSQRAAISKFAELCVYIKPSKCRKYITALLPPFFDIINEGDDTIQVIIQYYYILLQYH